MQKSAPSGLQPAPDKFNFRKIPKLLQWGLLLLVSAVLIFAGEVLHLPAALLLGAMVGGILMAAGESTVRVHSQLSTLAQAVVGLLIARAITPEFFSNMGRHLPIILVSMLFVLFASTLIGYLLARFRVLPGTTAVWGSSPGAATAMTLMAESFGADARLVAFMQYLRVVLVATTASLVVRLGAGVEMAAPAAVDWFPPLNPSSLGATLLLVLGGAFLGHISRIPTGAMLVPLVLGAILQDTGVITIDLPPWLLAISYTLIGWRIGLGFSRAIIAHAARAFPAVLASTLILIAVCGLFGMALGHMLDLDPLTAYLATSPGGADTVAIIAASTNVDLPFIIAMQTSRFFVVLFAGPAIARFVAKRVEKRLEKTGK
ncbi:MULTISPECIES: AbrB family transcriptional regulator [Brucella]|uniref:Transport protein n=1 Tax=Ochrobactrum soli TaxID=2448455 RepID=A0A2P9HPM0_9HYPH|nr:MULTISPECIES: AbrB family transcriptional regulator [Brucella]MCI1000248.1 AbrB family transcriptional regulator [Ochrobactrum sp. C6C9]MDX4074106.1 AbrB family transcriptional regulator [Brucella sp. NBRC 113783]RRD25054.1 AbrB family transcriptional regulator [Brucellaceae bacterium VT-16-1752]SPL66037.1 Putative transport protein [[Ochrobactrum] soli]